MNTGARFRSLSFCSALFFCSITANVLATGSGPSGSPFASEFTLFESGQVRPLALSADGQYLYALNTPDNRLEILRLQGSGLVPVGSVAVLLDPVSLVPLAAGVTNAGGDFRTEINIPNLTSLIGLRVFGQGVIAPAAGPLFASNIDAVEVQ